MESLLREQYGADVVQLMDLDLTLTAFAAHPVYVPAFVFKRRHRGVKIHQFVSGLDSRQVRRYRYSFLCSHT